MSALWSGIPVGVQNGLMFALLISPTVVLAFVMMRGHRPLPLSLALLRSNLWTSFGFMLLIAVSIAIGVGLIAQERTFRVGTAQAAEKFDLIIGAPGSETSLLFATLFLQPTTVGLLDGTTFDEIAGHERTDMAAPIGLGDSFEGSTVVGTTAELINHLGGLSAGRLWTTELEAIAGADAPVAVGDRFEPAHGQGEAADEDLHEGLFYEVVGQMARTNSPWDRAIIVPIEAVWSTHGLANGHAPERGDQLGPPFDAAFFPGTSAVVVVADSLSGTYQMHSDFTGDTRTMAILPGAVLGYLYRVIGDARSVATGLVWTSLALVAFAVLCGLAILSRYFIRHLAVLRAIGAPLRFVSATIWFFATLILGGGVLLGCLGSFAAVFVIGAIVSQRSGINLPAQFGWTEAHLLAGFLSLAVLFAAVIATRLAHSANPITLRS